MEWKIALVSGSIGVIGVILGFCLSISHDYYKDLKIRKRIASAIKSEIDTLFELAERTSIVQFINRPFQRDDYYNLQVNFNYFIVFESNANLISLLGSVLARRLIEFYSYTKQILDLLKLYEDFLKRPNTDQELQDILNRMRTNLESATNLRNQINVEIEEIEKERFFYFFK